MQYGIERKCESIIGLFGSEDEQIVPTEYDSPTLPYRLSRRSSVGTKAYSMVKANGSGWTTYTADSYSKDGLLALYDVKENVALGSPHSNTVTTWKNLAYDSSHATDMSINRVDWWSDSCINLDGSDIFASSSFKTVNGIAIECCFRIDDETNEDHSKTYCPISIGDSNTWFSNRRRIVIKQSDNGIFVNTYQRNLGETSSESDYSYSVNSTIGGLKTVYTYMPSCEFSAETQKLFVNSSEHSSGYGTSLFTTESGRYVNGLLVGIDGWDFEGCVSPFVGKIMRIGIYNKNLSEDTIRLHHSIDVARYG